MGRAGGNCQETVFSGRTQLIHSPYWFGRSPRMKASIVRLTTVLQLRSRSSSSMPSSSLRAGLAGGSRAATAAVSIGPSASGEAAGALLAAMASRRRRSPRMKR
jgi:hypothetical protein